MKDEEMTNQIKDSLIENLKKTTDEFYPKNSVCRVVCATCDCNMAFIVRYQSYDLSFRCFICEDKEKK